MRRRILAAVVSFTAIAIAVFLVWSAIAIHSAQERGDLLALQHEASVVAQALPSGRAVTADDLRALAEPEHLVGLYDASGALIVGDGPVASDAVVGEALTGDFAEGYVDGNLVAAVPAVDLVHDVIVIIRVEEPASVSRSRFVRSLLALVAVAAIIVGLAAFGAKLVARRLSEPIEQLRRWASVRAPDEPPPEATGIGELDELRSELLADRERIQELLQRERSFSSQVSHQLRTPVTALRVAVETELEAPRADRAEILQESLGQIDRLEATIASLLQLARHDRRPLEAVSVRDVAAAVADTHRRGLPAERTITIDGDAPEVTTDRAAVDHVLDVLVDNAVRHGAGAIGVTIDGSGTSVTVDVSDEGARPSPQIVFGEQSSDRGHGIGLRLARSLAESIDGTLTLCDGPTTRFRLSIPTRRAVPPPR